MVERAHEADLGELRRGVHGLALGRRAGRRSTRPPTRSAASLSSRCGSAGADRVEQPLDVGVDHLLELLRRRGRGSRRRRRRRRSRPGCRARRSARRVAATSASICGRVAHVARLRERALDARGRRRRATPARRSRPPSASARAVAAPMPLVAPVTSATRPSTPLMGRSLLGGSARRAAATAARRAAGLRSKNPTGFSMNPMVATGITGQSSGRGHVVVAERIPDDDVAARRRAGRRSSTPAGRRRRGAGWGSRRPRSARRARTASPTGGCRMNPARLLTGASGWANGTAFSPGTSR